MVSHKSLNYGLIVKIIVIIVAYILTLFAIFGSAFIQPTQFDTYQSLKLIIFIFAGVLLAQYFFFMILSPVENLRVFFSGLYWKRKQPYYYPRVSVIVPAWNEEVGIIQTLDSLLSSHYDNLEVVVINDGSTDDSADLIKNYNREFRKRIKNTNSAKKITYRYQKNGGKGIALNKAISLSSGEIIISIDADCLVTPEAISAFVRQFRNPNVAAVVGNVRVANTETLLGALQRLEFMFTFYFKKGESLLNSIYIIGGAAGAFRREVFEELGTYSRTNITEDFELSMRIQDAGMRVVYASDAVVLTEGASELKGLKKQRLRWKRGRFETFHAYRHMFFSGRSHHNKILSCLVLPISVFTDIRMLFEIPFIVFLYFYAIVASDFSAFMSGIIVVSTSFFLLALFEDKGARHFSLFVIAPVSWCLFYIMIYVEASALFRSIYTLCTGEKVKWQSWDRKGFISN